MQCSRAEDYRELGFLCICYLLASKLADLDGGGDQTLMTALAIALIAAIGLQITIAWPLLWLMS